MIAAPIVLYIALACATVVPPPGSPVAAPTAAAGTKPPVAAPKPAWDVLGVCSALNEKGVQTYPSLNPR